MAGVKKTANSLLRLTKGFTLLEVLVALAVISLSLLGITRALIMEADSLGHLRDRTVASWVASNAITEVRLEPGLPQPSVREGVSQMAHRDWYWRVEVKATPEPFIRRLDAEVRLAPDSDYVLARMSGFRGRIE